MQVESAPKVSVCVVTYNQEKYIGQCLQSLVDQKTNFPFEIIVSDDCSTDGTATIVKDFKNKYPDLVKIFCHDKNMGGSDNYLFVHAQAAGEYIAHMDGDDYALPSKLKIQADFLDSNKNCSIVFHAMNRLDKGGSLEIKPLHKDFLGYKFYRKDIIEYVSIGCHSSKMYRAIEKAKTYPKFDLVDYTVNVIDVGNGYAAYCSDVPLGVYRCGVGISGSDAVNRAVLNALNYFKKEYPKNLIEINASAWMWTYSNFKGSKKTKWEFLKFAIKTFSIFGFVKFLKSRKFRRRLSAL